MRMKALLFHSLACIACLLTAAVTLMADEFRPERATFTFGINYVADKVEKVDK
jgi:hypothetical protein